MTKILSKYFLIVLFIGKVCFASGVNYPSCESFYNLKDPYNLILKFHDAQRVHQLLNQGMESEKLNSFGLRWLKLDQELTGLDWEKFYDKELTLSSHDKKFFDDVQFKRMNLSTTISGDHSYDKNAEQAKKNWQFADQRIHEWVRVNAPLTIDRMFELNEIIGKKLYFNGNLPGKMRTENVGVPYEVRRERRFQNALSARHIEPMLKVFVKWYTMNEGKLHPVHLAAQAYQRLNTIHPFPDGNGRTTRLIMDWILRRNGFPPGVFMGIEATYVIIFPDDVLGRNPSIGFVEEQVTKGLEWLAESFQTTKTEH